MFKEITDYIHSLYPREAFVPLHAPVFVGNEKKYLDECIDSTYVSSVGKFVDRFEDEVARFTGAARAVVCVNGTNALHLALILAGVKADDEVITQPLSFVATCNAISYCGAHPLFIDVDRDTLGLSPVKLNEWLEANTELRGQWLHNKQTGRRISACVPMHTFGHPARLDELISICQKYNITLFEDAAESIGSYYKGRHTGTFGTIGVLSFNGNKTITTGGGGMLLFNDTNLADRAKHLSTQAKVPHSWEFDHDEVGYNYRMPNINAALGCAQMETLPLFLEKKRELAGLYREYFSNKGIPFIIEPEGCQSNYWLNAIMMPTREERDNFLTFTNNNGIMTRPVWRLLNRLPMFSHAPHGNLENAIYLEERIVNIPSSVRL